MRPFPLRRSGPAPAILLLLLVLLLPAAAQGKSVTCDFYDIPELPDGWNVSMAPGFNNDRGVSLGHYYNKRKDCSVMIQVAPAEAGLEELDAAAANAERGLREGGCTVVSGPERDGELVRIEATVTGAPSIVWVGTEDGLTALTVASGDREECGLFLSSLRNASPRLIPGGISR